MAKVLVVDDEDSIRSLLERILSRAGHIVLSSANGQEALNQLPQQNVDIILLDIKMPGISGMEVLQQLSARWPEICVIMLTAMTDLEIAVEAMKQGAYDYITKPFNHDDLIFKIQRALEKHNLKLENERHQAELQQRVAEQTKQLQQNFTELVGTLAREHQLIYTLAGSQHRGKDALARLPQELRKPMASVKEFREALIRILRKSSDAPSRSKA